MKKVLQYTPEELNSFLDHTNYKTFRSYYLIYKANIKIFFKMAKASLLGYLIYHK